MIKKRSLEFLYCSSGQIRYQQIYYGIYFWCPLSFTNLTHLLPDGPLACSLCYMWFLFNCLLHSSGSTNICQWNLRNKSNTCMLGLSPLLEAWNIFSINYISEENFIVLIYEALVLKVIPVCLRIIFFMCVSS